MMRLRRRGFSVAVVQRCGCQPEHRTEQRPLPRSKPTTLMRPARDSLMRKQAGFTPICSDPYFSAGRGVETTDLLYGRVLLDENVVVLEPVLTITSQVGVLVGHWLEHGVKGARRLDLGEERKAENRHSTAIPRRQETL